MLIGHQKQWQFLKKSVELEKIPHGILFCGQEQLGKKTLAIEFAKLLNCSSSDLKKRPCQTCRNCQDIQKMVYPDFILIKPKGPAFVPLRGTSAGKEIQISQIRDLIWKLSLRSYSAPYKIAVLDKAHLMTQEAQSCFLKLLEEPKGRTILILITEYPETLLPTIISRIQKLKFFPVEKTEIENYIISKGILEKDAKHLASISFGRPGLIANFLSNSQKLKNQEKLISDLLKISQSDLSSRFKYAKDLIEKDSDLSYNLSAILNIWLGYFRNIFLSRFYSSASNKQTKDDNFNRYSLSKLTKIISLIQSTNFLLSTTNINPKLAIELLLMEL
ncbi:MAG: hypothetical protein HY979_00620 [Candidatus Magasanikbacteria bacterium]|nr:hypothetical protein [Candidatus Magasanikbacteria bacterium]